MNNFSASIETAQILDSQDKLKDYREEFLITDPKIIYLDGNSLGRLPLKTQENLSLVINNQWGDRLIRSWNEGWYELSQKCGEKISKIVGAKKTEVIVGDSTSINLYKLVLAALKFSSKKKKIITDEFNFPSDHYIIQGTINQLSPSYELKVVKSKDGITIAKDDIIEEVDENTALVVLSHASFKSSFLYDMEEITEAIHKNGSLILWDLSHSVGVVDINLNYSNVDFAIGCTYKYLNGGPGAPAFLYVHEDLQNRIVSPIWGWFGDENPFDFDLQYQPAKGMNKFLVGTPPILSLSAVESGLDLVISARISNIRKKSIAQTEYMIRLFNEKLKKHRFTLGTPLDSKFRGSHISIRHKEAAKIIQAMTDERNETIVLPDYRAPNNIRLGISPLYNSFEDIWRGIDKIENILSEDTYKKYTGVIDGVT